MGKYSFEDYQKIVAKLRSPEGCPWDRVQTHESLRTCLMNETAEVLAAMDVWKNTGDAQNFCEELGDLLLQIVLHSEIAREEGLFSMEEIIEGAAEKMIRRHPHVFGTETETPDWEEIKRREREGIPQNVQEAKEFALKEAKKEILSHFAEK